MLKRCRQCCSHSHIRLNLGQGGSKSLQVPEQSRQAHVSARRNAGREQALPAVSWQPGGKSAGGISRNKARIDALGGRTVDSFTLAENAQSMLQKGLESSVLRLIERNTKMNLTVVWNHLITWRIGRGDVAAAFKDFNNMKKRGHFPNEYTYTILFNALARGDGTTSRPKFEHLIDNLLVDGRVKPSVIHLNVALKICSTLQDLPLAYDIIRRFDEAGFDQLDAISYSTLFRLQDVAIRQTLAQGVPPGAHRVQPWKRSIPAAAREELDSAKAIWQDMIDPWRKGIFKLDSRCVVAFARVMQHGSSDDYKHAIAAITETFNLPPYIPHDHPAMKYGNKLEMQPSVARILTELAAGLEDDRQEAHYWRVCQDTPSVHLSSAEYEARLRALVAGSDAREARQILMEMRDKGVKITPLALRFIIQCHFTNRREDLENCNEVMKQFLGSSERARLFTFAVITTFASAILRNKSTAAVVQTLDMVSSFDWQELAERANEREKAILEALLPKLLSKCRALAHDADAADKRAMLDSFNNSLKVVMRQYFPHISLENDRQGRK